jgi:SPP1 family predicted phage head-tail adaptor
MSGLDAGTLDRRVRIERPVADSSLDGAGSGTWQLVTEAWVQVQDVLPSRSERLADGMNFAARPARVRMRYRSDITSEMRFVLDGRAMQIISGPAEIGRRDGLEFMVEEYRPAGGGA